MSESLSLSNGQLMSTLAGAASAFVAILAGFYTTKIFSISTDKKRSENRLNELNSNIEEKKRNLENCVKDLDKKKVEKQHAINNEEWSRAEECETSIKDLSDSLKKEEIAMINLQTEVDSHRLDLKSISFPKNWLFGFISFVIFAVLGVIVPLTSQWWYPFTKESTDLLAIILFGIGLVITFIYLGFEAYSIFHENKKS